MFNVRHSLKKYFVGLMLVSFILGPLGVSANETNLEKLQSLQNDVEVAENAIKLISDISSEEKSKIEAVIDRIKDEIAIQTVIETSGIAMEVIIESNDTARVEVVTNDVIEKLVINFDSSFATADQTVLLAETVAQTAAILQLNESTLTSGVAQVTTFSGLTLPVSIPITTGITNVTPDTAVMSASYGRTNIKSIRIDGSLPDFEITAQVVYGPEGLFDTATVTRQFSFSPPASANTPPKQLQDLVLQGQVSISQEFGIQLSVVQAMSVISIERYKKFDDVPQVLPSLAGTNNSSAYVIDNFTGSLQNSLIPFFGSYSVIESIYVRTARVSRDLSSPEGLIVTFTSDQDEVLTFYFGATWKINTDTDTWNRSSKNIFRLTYSIHGAVVERQVTGNVPYHLFVDFLERYLEGIGEEFGIDDKTFISELAAFFANNPTTLRIIVQNLWHANQMDQTTGICYAPRDKDILVRLLSYLLDGLQFTGSIDDITALAPTYHIIVDHEIKGASVQCRNLTTSFPSLP